MKKPIILRKRYIPNEIVDISGDDLIFRNEDILVTKWKAIRPRPDFYGGISFSFLKAGFKLSKFYSESGEFLYWYCDIIDVIFDKRTDTYTFDDLLVDIKVMPDGFVKVLDCDELGDALKEGIVSNEQASRALKILDKLLTKIYKGEFPPMECKDFEY